MRAAHILRKYDPAEWGGTETAIHQLTSGLSRHEVDSVVFCPKLSAQSSTQDPMVESGCAMRRFNARLPAWGLSPEQKTKLTAVGGNIVSFGLFTSLLGEPGVGLVHSHALGRLGAIAQAAAKYRGLPFVVSVHGGAYDLPQTVLRDFAAQSKGGWDWGKPIGLLLNTRNLFNSADAIVVVNPREAERIRERHPGRRVVVQPHGIPAARFAVDHRAAARTAFPSLQGRRVLLMPGRLDPVKNQDWVLAQAKELARRHKDVLIVFAGASTDAAYSKALADRIASEELTHNVLMTGQLPPGDPKLIGLFQEARAVVLAGASETFGLVILEAWAAGTPVISSRTSGATALVDEGVNGFLFGLDDPAAFHGAAELMLSRPEIRDPCGASGRAKAVNQYDTTVIAGRMAKLYEQLIEEKQCTT